MDEIREAGIVLRTYPSGESDLVIKILTGQLGKISAIARYARKSKSKFSGGVEIFDKAEFCLKPGRGSLYIVQSIDRLPGFSAIRSNLDKFALSGLLAESFDFLLREESGDCVEAYELLSLGLRAVSEATDCKEALRATFLALSEILKLTGFFAAEELQSPSSNALRRLIQRVEESTEKALKTRASVEEVLHKLRATNAPSAANSD